MNKNNFITLVIFTILIPTLVFGQACLQNGITLSSQQDVDLFKSFYPNCVEIQGDLCINGFGISNLDSLITLEKVGQNIYIGNTSLTDLTGLNSLTEIGGQLFMEYNNQFVSFVGLDQFTNLGSDLVIRNHPLLNDLNNLIGLTNIDNLSFNNCDMLTDLSGLKSLNTIGSLTFSKMYYILPSFFFLQTYLYTTILTRRASANAYIINRLPHSKDVSYFLNHIG